MGTPVAGIGGAVKAGAVTLANIHTWSITAKSDVTETTAFGATGAWATNTATIRKWSAKFDGNTDATDATGQVTLYNGIGSTFAFEFDIDATHHWAGSAILDVADPKSSAKGINDVSFSVTGTGPLTFT